LKALDVFLYKWRVQLGLVVVAAIGASSGAESVVAIAKGWKRKDQSRRYRTVQRGRRQSTIQRCDLTSNVSSVRVFVSVRFSIFIIGKKKERRRR
jgi:hypothetical protein